jgi:hypothetical protein
MNTSPSLAAVPGTYTPGYAKRKLLVIFYGLVLFTLGMTQLWTPFRLLATGNSVRAEATTVTKAKKGSPDLILRDDLQIKAQLESRDRSYIFWNSFRFQTAPGRSVEVRASVGSQLGPLFPLFDDDGLPSTALVYYNPNHPEEVVFPTLFSTWFFPGILLFVGLGLIAIGGVLYYWADKPIELPHIPTGSPAPTPGLR